MEAIGLVAVINWAFYLIGLLASPCYEKRRRVPKDGGGWGGGNARSARRAFQFYSQLHALCRTASVLQQRYHFKRIFMQMACKCVPG